MLISRMRTSSYKRRLWLLWHQLQFHHKYSNAAYTFFIFLCFCFFFVFEVIVQSIHSHLQDQFQLYYDATMASLKAIFFNESDASKLMLRAKSVKCISSIAVAVGKEKFMNDATKVRIHIILYFFGSINTTIW